MAQLIWTYFATQELKNIFLYYKLKDFLLMINQMLDFLNNSCTFAPS